MRISWNPIMIIFQEDDSKTKLEVKVKNIVLSHFAFLLERWRFIFSSLKIEYEKEIKKILTLNIVKCQAW